MMKAVGFNKLFFILVLAAFLVLAFLYSQHILAPNLKKQQSELASSKQEISEMTNNLNLLSAGLEKFELQKDEFKKISELGYFNPQNRVETKKIITAIQRESRLRVKFKINAANTFTNEKSREAGYKILNTDIEFSLLGAIEDADIYKFIYLLNYGFPGQIIIKDFSISREAEITQPLLRKIGVGQAEPIIEAALNVSWQTMVPDETLSSSGNFYQEEGQ